MQSLGDMQSHRSKCERSRDLGNSPGRVAAVTLHMREQLIDVRQI